jgi:phosphatidylglycerol lysyltransferase
MQNEIGDIKFRHARRTRNIIRYIIGFLTGLVGIADMLSAIVPRMDWCSVLGVWPIESYHGVNAQTFVVVVGFFLIMLSYGLTKGKKHAWWITVVLLLLSAILHVQRHGTVLATLVAVLLAMVLGALSEFFQAKSNPPSAWRGYIALLFGLGIVTFYTIGGFFVLYDDFEPLVDRFGIDNVILHILTFAHLHALPYGTHAFFFSRALPILCASAIVYGMIQICRPVAAVLLPDTEERQKIARLVRTYGKNSISYFALDDAKTYFFSSSSKTVISYVLEGSTAVVAGDPIGPENELDIAIKEFVNFCSGQDWSVVFWQTSDKLIDLYRQVGLHHLKIGEDAIIDVQNFSLKGGAMANVRTSAKRAEKEGLQVIYYRGQVTDQEQLWQMEQISHYWLECKGGVEMGFSMGRFTTQGDNEQLYALAVDGRNKVHAFVSFVPIYGRRGWGLDLMRRADTCAPGTMELLLARTIEYMKTTGTEMASLGLAPLSNVNGENETFLGSRIDYLSNRFGNPAKNQSLFNFKKKFQPTWESRYLVYSDALSLPKIGWALYHAHQSDATMLRTIRQYLRDWQQSRQERHIGAAQTIETAKA